MGTVNLESCCDVIKRLLSTAMAGQQRFSAEGILGSEWLQRRQVLRL